MIYLSLLIFAMSLNLGLIYFSWKRKDITGVSSFLFLMISVTLWLTSIFCMLVSRDEKSALFWLNTEFFNIALAPVLLLIFVSRFQSSRIFNRFRIVLLLIIPALTQAAVWTNETFHLFFTDIQVAEINNLMVISEWQPGLWFPVHTLYSFALVFIALTWLVFYAIRNFMIYKNQSIIIIIGSLALVIPNLGLALGILPADINILPFSFVIMNICYTLALFKFKLFKVVPVARNKLIDMMNEGMVVLDNLNTVVDLNPAASGNISLPLRQAVGKPADEVFSLWPSIRELLLLLEIPDREISVEQEGRFYEIQISGLQDNKKNIAGRLILFRDITDRKIMELEKDALLEALNRKNNELEQLYSMALDANPMTGLPGNNSIASIITRAMEEKEEKAVIYCDLDNFKAFNDRYGFSQGDEVIKFTARLLKEILASQDCDQAFTGHIGGDDFVLLVPSDKGDIITRSIIAEFDAQILQFYSSSDVSRGYIDTKDRLGNRVQYPMMCISMALVDLKYQYYSRYIEIGDALAALKKMAKSQKGSVCQIDKRRKKRDT